MSRNIKFRIKEECEKLPVFNRQKQIIVSLTSYPERINSVTETLIPIFNQTVPPDQVVLWLSREQFQNKEKDLPSELRTLKKYGLKIIWCNDLKPHKKYFYALKEYADDIVITIDDDIVYSKDLIEKLYKSYLKFPNAVSAMRVHKILFDQNGYPLEYERWIKEYPAEIGTPRYDLIPTGAGGILYPPHCLHKLALNEQIIRETCLYADDLWLKFMELLNDTPVVLAANQEKLKYIDHTQETSLWQRNVEKNQNDVQLKNILNFLSVDFNLNSIFQKAIEENTYLYKGSCPKVSVIMPVYNVEKYLPAAIESVLNQTLRNLEIICVNDGSTDSSLEILQRYQKKDGRIIIIDKKNSGYGDSMNVGLKAATGEFIGIVETDDFITPDMYATLYCIAIEKKLDLIKGDIIQFSGEGPERNSRYISVAGRESSYYNRVTDIQTDVVPLYFTMNTWAGIYRRAYLERNNILHNTTPGASYQDSGFWFQTFIFAQRVYFINRPFYWYRQDNPNSSINNPDKVYCVCDEYEYIYGILEKNPELKRIFIDIFVYRRYYSYKFALSKMGKQYKYEFLKRFAKDFQFHKQRGELKSTFFSVDEYDELKCIIADPAKYYIKNFYDGGELSAKDTEVKVALLEIKCEEQQSQIQRILSMRMFREKPHYVRRMLQKFKNAIHLCIKFIISWRDEGFLSAKGKATEKIFSYLKGEPKDGQGKNRINVLFIASDNAPSSGAFLSMVNLAYQLKKLFNVQPFIVLPHQGKGEFLLEEHDLEYCIVESFDWVIGLDEKRDRFLKKNIQCKKKVNRSAVQSIQKVIEEQNIDIVHINTTYSYVGALAALECKVPFVWHLREFLEEDQHKTLWNRKKGNRLIEKADKIIAISDSLYYKYENIFSIDKLIRVYNGIDAGIFYQPDKSIFKYQKSIFVFVGGFAVYKGHLEFAKAIIELAKRGYKDFEIWFIGTGNYKIRDEVVQLLTENDLSDKFKIFGYIKNVEDYLKQADIAFCCSKSEAFGRITVEAMLSGNLLIGADTAGTKELVINNQTGLLYQSGDYIDLADKIEYALIHKEEMKKIAEQGRRYMFDNMTSEINADNIKKIYDDILKEQGH